MSPAIEVFARFLRLGVTSFGGPVAHIGYFRREFVERAGWLDDETYGEIVAVCSVLPGPTSSQVGMTIGTRHAGLLGGMLAWVAFTAPSAIVMGAFGWYFNPLRTPHVDLHRSGPSPITGALAGLECVAAAVVLVAVIAMGRNLLKSRFGYAAAAAAFAATLVIEAYAPSLTWLVLVGTGAAAAVLAPPTALPSGSALPRGSRSVAVGAAAVFAFCLIALPALAPLGGEPAALFTVMFRSGALVFGGGHVVLPFLESVVRSQSVDQSRFLFGYGAAQAVPGPLFTFAAYLGAADVRLAGMPVWGATIALVGIFASSGLLLAMAAPLWAGFRALPRAANILTGLNAAVVGLLAAVLVNPIAFQIGRLPAERALPIAAVAFALLQFARLPSWVVVLFGAAVGAIAFLHGAP